MPDTNPYSAPATASMGPVSAHRLWTAYLIAPFMAPMSAAIAVFLISFVQQVMHPEDVGANPMSLIFGPLCMMIVGVPISYGVAGLIGMPSVYWLQARDRLNGWSICLIALACAAAIASLILLVGLVMILIGISELSEIWQILLSGLVTFLLLSPFTLLSAMVYWWIGVRVPKTKSVAVD